MVSRPELGSDPSFGSGRESGRDRLQATHKMTHNWTKTVVRTDLEWMGLNHKGYGL